MDKHAQDSLAAYGWFGVCAGASILMLALAQGLRAPAGDNLVAVVTGAGALLLFVFGWLMLTVASYERTGRWPQWGMLHIWPTAAAVLGFLAVSAVLMAVVYYLGGAMERLMLARIPADVAMREVLSWTGYASGCVWLLLNLPAIGQRMVGAAREYSATLPDDLSPV